MHTWLPLTRCRRKEKLLFSTSPEVIKGKTRGLRSRRKWLHSRTVRHALHTPQGCWVMLQGEGLANKHHFKLIKEQFKKWDHFLGRPEWMKKPTVITFQLQSFSTKISLCERPTTHTPAPVPCACSWDSGAPTKCRQSMAWARDTWTGRQRSGELNIGPKRETGCAGAFRASPQSAGWCRNRARAGAAEAREDTSHC